MNIERTVLIYKFTGSYYAFYNPIAKIFTSDSKPLVEFYLFVKTLSGKWIQHSNFNINVPHKDAEIIFDAIMLICQSNKESLLNLENGYAELSNFAKIKIKDFQNTNIELYEWHSSTTSINSIDIEKILHACTKII